MPAMIEGEEDRMGREMVGPRIAARALDRRIKTLRKQQDEYRARIERLEESVREVERLKDMIAPPTPRALETP